MIFLMIIWVMGILFTYWALFHSIPNPTTYDIFRCMLIGVFYGWLLMFCYFFDILHSEVD
jgi:hypothetical protein